MTLYHFGNCIALIYVPYYLTYKYSGLSEYGAYWKCFQAGGIYMFTQLVKMMILATFFSDTETATGHNLVSDLLKTTVDFGDLIGMYMILNSIPGKGHSKVLTAGIGWATAEVILSRALFLWVGARGAEFDWKYIQKCLESNILLVQHITSVTLLWLWSRHDLNKATKPAVSSLLLLNAYKPLILDLAFTKFTIGAWAGLAVRAVITAVMGLFTLKFYANLVSVIGIY